MVSEVEVGVISSETGMDAARGRSRFRWGPIPSGALPASAGADGDQGALPPKKRRRRSRWETAEPAPSKNVPEASQGSSENALILFPTEVVLSNGVKINLPPALTGRHPSGDPEIVKLHQQLSELDRKIRAGVLDIPPEHERSPSPEPIYDANGIRQNTREQRYKEKQSRRRTELIEELIKKDTMYTPPSDYKPMKKWRKIPIPYREFPDYNFIGLIIGPRGNTQKRMQSETNTRIAIRGRGSVKEGAARSATYDYGEEEDLHVLIVGDTQEDVDKASSMVEQLLQPMDEEMNVHKQEQLRELALINGTLKEEDLVGKKALDVYTLPDAIQAKVDEQYARDLAKINPGEAAKDEEEYQSFLAELGGTDPRSMQKGSEVGKNSEVGAKTIDPCKLWIGNLSPTVDSVSLRALFEPYGRIISADVKTDSSGTRGYAFVNYADEAQARTAIQALHGYYLEGKNIIVRVKGEKPEEGTANMHGGFRRGLGAGPPSRPEENLPPECRLYVSHLPQHVDETTLRREFERFGGVVSIKLIVDRETGKRKGYGFVAMADPHAAYAAISGLNGYSGFDPNLRPIVVRQNVDRRFGVGHPYPGGMMPHYGAPVPPPEQGHTEHNYAGANYPPLPPYPPLPSGGAQNVQPGAYNDPYGGYGSYQSYNTPQEIQASAGMAPPPPNYQHLPAAPVEDFQPPLPSGPPPTGEVLQDSGMTAPPLPADVPPLLDAPPPPPPLSFETGGFGVHEMPPPPPPTDSEQAYLPAQMMPYGSVEQSQHVIPPLPPQPPNEIQEFMGSHKQGETTEQSEYERFMAEMHASGP